MVENENKTERRLQPGVAMDRSNDQEAYYVMNLLTRKRVHCKRWNERAMTEGAIKQIKKLAEK